MNWCAGIRDPALARVSAVLIMAVGSLGMWIGTPLLWLWVGSQVQSGTGSLSAAFAVMFAGVIAWVWALAWLLAQLSDIHRASTLASGDADPGHEMLERVLVASAAVVLIAFAVWFFLLAGASPVPIGITV